MIEDIGNVVEGPLIEIGKLARPSLVRLDEDNSPRMEICRMRCSSECAGRQCVQKHLKCMPSVHG